MKTVDEAKEANVKQDEKIELLSEKIASNDSQVLYLASELKATQDELASRNRQIKRRKFVQTEVDDDDKGYKSDEAGKRLKRDHMKKTQDFLRTTTKGSERKQRQLKEALGGQLGAGDDSTLHTMINGISNMLKRYSTGGRPSNEGITVKRVLLTAVCSELDPSQCSLASKLLGVKSETLTDHSNLSHKIATGEESMIVCRGKERFDTVSQETIDFVTRFWINSSKPAPGKSDFKKNPHDKSKEERIYYNNSTSDEMFKEFTKICMLEGMDGPLEGATKFKELKPYFVLKEARQSCVCVYEVDGIIR